MPFQRKLRFGGKTGFTVNNDPDAEWTRETYIAFADWFASKGNDSLLPPKQSFGPIRDCSFTLTADGQKVHISPVHVLEKDAIDGERRLLGRTVFDSEAKGWKRDEYILIPEDYPEQIRTILSGHDLRTFDWHSILYRERKMTDGEKDFFRPVLQIHVTFEDGKRLQIDTNDADDVEMLRPLVTELLAYHDSLFDEEHFS